MDTKKKSSKTRVNKGGRPPKGYKQCPICKKTKTISHFGKNRNNPDGLRKRCKLCCRAHWGRPEMTAGEVEIERLKRIQESVNSGNFPTKRSNWRNKRQVSDDEMAVFGYRQVETGPVPRILQDQNLVSDAAQLIYDGVSKEKTCKALGMAKDTWIKYEKRGRLVLDAIEAAQESENPDALRNLEFTELDIACAKFTAAIGEAVAAFSRRNMNTIRRAGEADPRNWQAPAWLQERCFPDEYGRKERVTHKHEGKITVAQLIELSIKQAPITKASIDSSDMECGTVEVEGRPVAALPPAEDDDENVVSETEVLEAEVIHSEAWGDAQNSGPTPDPT